MVPAPQQNWTPATFRERGVAVPFTSPALAGARIRLLERRSDLVVPHPGGARGVYIFTLGSLTEFCAPTLHDLHLAHNLQDLHPISPASVRAAARASALQGLAGREAAARAAACEAGERAARLAMEAYLLASASLPSASHSIDPAQRARSALLSLASRTGGAPEAVKADLERLCAQVVAAGLDVPKPRSDGFHAGRCGVLLQYLADMAQQLGGWLLANGDASAAGQVAEAVQAMVAAGRLALTQAQSMIADPALLLARWANEPEMLAQRLTRPDWLLDGWEPICLMWQLAMPEHRPEALAEAAAILPPFPPEGEAWLQTAPALLSALRGRRQPAPLLKPGLRMPSEMVGLIARNERIRALSA